MTPKRSSLGGLLQRYDERAKTITVDGKTYRRGGRHEGTYYAKAGPVTLPRTLYRNAAIRNDKTADAISLKLGCVEDGLLPEAADACLLQSVPAGEAEKLAKVGRVQYSASSFKQVGTSVGGLYEAERGDIEDALIEACVIPDKTRSLTVSLDRVALPMEVDVPRKAGRPKKGAAKRSIARALTEMVRRCTPSATALFPRGCPRDRNRFSRACWATCGRCWRNGPV